VDQACTRDQGLIVTDGSSFFSEEKRHCKFEKPSLRAGNSPIRVDQYLQPGPLSNQEGDPDRSSPERGLAEGSIPAAAGDTGGLSRPCPARSSPGQLRLRQYWLGRRLQRRAHAIRPA